MKEVSTSSDNIFIKERNRRAGGNRPRFRGKIGGKPRNGSEGLELLKNACREHGRRGTEAHKACHTNQ